MGRPLFHPLLATLNFTVPPLYLLLMDNLRPFQIGLLIVFGLIAVGSVFMLAAFQGFSLNAVNPYGDKVVLWGTFPAKPFTDAIQEIGRTDKDFMVVQYVEVDPRTFESELVDAIAEGTAPDAVILSHENLVSLRSKLQPVPYDVFSERMLRDTYVDGGEVFARSDGLYALPFFVDPIVMYWNRDLFSSSGLARPPATWEQLTDMVSQVTLRDATRNILQATVAFGDYQNVVRFKEVILTLLQQSGSRLVEEGDTRYVVAIDSAAGDDGRKPLTSTLQFFVEFSNSSSPLYSWNRTFQNDTSAFLAEKLALYFSYGSEAGRLREQNPNFNFDVVAVPQGAGATIKRVYGKIYGLALVKAGDNQQGAYRALLKFSEAETAAKLAESFAVAPAHRSSLAEGAADPVRQTIFSQALIARGWLDPGTEKSLDIFGQMIDDVVSGRQKVSGAALDTVRRLELAF